MLISQLQWQLFRVFLDIVGEKLVLRRTLLESTSIAGAVAQSCHATMNSNDVNGSIGGSQSKKEGGITTGEQARTTSSQLAEYKL